MIIFILTFCTACNDAMEIDDSVYAIVIGIDKGTTNRVRMTIQYPTYKEGGSSGGQSMASGDKSKENALENSNVHTIESSSILEGINLFNTAITRAVSLTHTKMLVISEEFTREGIEKYVAPLARFRETRRTMQVVISQGDAEEFIRQNKTNIGPSISKAAELMVTQSDVTGYFPKVSFFNLYEAFVSPYSQGIAAYAGINKFTEIQDKKAQDKSPLAVDKGILPGELARSGVTKREFVGTAVFSGPKMVGTLDSLDTRYMLMVQSKFRKGIMTFKDKNQPEAVIPCDMRMGRKTKVSAKFEDGKPIIDVKINLEADVGAIQSRIEYEDFNKIGELNELLKECIETGVKKMIDKTQKEFKADIFGFGFEVAKKFSTIKKFEEYGWLGHYPDAQVNVIVEVNIRRTGLMIKSVPIHSYETDKGTGGGQ